MYRNFYFVFWLDFFPVYPIYNTFGNWEEKYTSCDILKSLLDENGIRYQYLDMMEMPHKTMTYLKMHFSSYPMVWSVKCFSTFNDRLEYFI